MVYAARRVGKVSEGHCENAYTRAREGGSPWVNGVVTGITTTNQLVCPSEPSGVVTRTTTSNIILDE